MSAPPTTVKGSTDMTGRPILVRSPDPDDWGAEVIAVAVLRDRVAAAIEDTLQEFVRQGMSLSDAARVHAEYLAEVRGDRTT